MKNGPEILKESTTFYCSIKIDNYRTYKAVKNAHTLKQAIRKEQGWRVSRTVSVRATKRKLPLAL